MSKKVIIESTLKQGQLENILPFLQTNLPNVRGFEGCLNVSIFLDKQSRKMIFDEEWLSTEDHQRYINTIAENGVMGELISFLESPPEIKYLERVVV